MGKIYLFLDTFELCEMTGIYEDDYANYIRMDFKGTGKHFYVSLAEIDFNFEFIGWL